MSETESDSDPVALERHEAAFPDEAAPQSDPDRFVTHDSYTTKHVYRPVPRDGAFTSACGSHDVEVDEADELTVVNARELLLTDALKGDPGTDTSHCESCRRSADLDQYVNPETLRKFIDGELDASDEEALPAREAEYNPVELSLDAEIQIPANERASHLLEAVGTIVAEQTAPDRWETVPVEGEPVEENPDTADDDE